MLMFLVMFCLVVPVTSVTSTLTATVTRDQASTQLKLECSLLGMCDHDTGVCACFGGYASSDGRAARGRLGDCGFDEKA